MLAAAQIADGARFFNRPAHGLLSRDGGAFADLFQQRKDGVGINAFNAVSRGQRLGAPDVQVADAVYGKTRNPISRQVGVAYDPAPPRMVIGLGF
jgi:hypothetical protein